MLFSKKSNFFIGVVSHVTQLEKNKRRSKYLTYSQSTPKRKMRTMLSILAILSISLSVIFPTNVYASDTQTYSSSKYSNPVIDSEKDFTDPVLYHKVSGHFEGTDKNFNFYFPAKNQWKGRFFQIMYPTFDENASDKRISFGAENGAYTVQTNGGSGYEVDAAAAKYSREVAAKYYGTSKHIYGYIYGGSGGSYQTIGAAENTSGVWDGAVPYVIATQNAIPNNFFARAYARFVLQDKAEQIKDAMSPGGSGNPYDGLNDVEKQVLHEVTSLGVPVRAWQDYQYLLHTKSIDIPNDTAAAGLNDPNGLLSFASTVKSIDPTYVDDFWNKPGYLGTEDSELGKLFRDSKIDEMVTVLKVNRDKDNQPISLVLDSAPKDLKRTGFEYTLYNVQSTTEAGASLDTSLNNIQSTTEVGTLLGSLNPSTNVFTLDSGNNNSVLNNMDAGSKLRIDNRWILALLTYHRHQVPTEKDYYAWNEFRKSDGTPIYPQRSINVGASISDGVSGGASYSGNIKCKVILVANLLDCDAYPWSADWYASRVKKSLGKNYNDNFRIWYNDNADHIDSNPPTNKNSLVQYVGVLEQALLDLSNWVENGKAPAQSTNYKIDDTQVQGLSNKAGERGGIQPIVNLTVNGGDKVEIKVGQKVTFKAKAQALPNTGEIIDAEWDFLGNGDYSESSFGKPNQTVEVKDTFTYDKPGVYYPALRVTSNRNGDVNASFARVQNLDRVRVVVNP